MSVEYRYCPSCGKQIDVGHIRKTYFRGYQFEAVFCPECISKEGG